MPALDEKMLRVQSLEQDEEIANTSTHLPAFSHISLSKSSSKAELEAACC
jgi:hypothetical protein